MTESTPNESSESAPTSDATDVEPASSGTTAGTAESDASSAEPAPDDAKPVKLFGGLTPAEAARKRWESKRAREQDEDQAQAASARRDVALIRVTVETGAVIDKLAREAKQGNVQAARELREWLNKVETETDTSVSALDRATRQRMKARLLAELQEGDALDPSPPAPMPDGIAHGAVDDGAVGQAGRPGAEAHPADAGTPDDAEPRGSTSA